MQAIENVIFKVLFVTFLLIKFVSQLLDFISQTFLSHSQVINDKSQVLIYSIKEFKFNSHLVGAFVQVLNIDFFWANVSFEFFDLIIQHKLKLFQFLRWLSQVINSSVFVFDCGLHFFKFSFMGFNSLL
jgi:hypothetical protein